MAGDLGGAFSGNVTFPPCLSLSVNASLMFPVSVLSCVKATWVFYPVSTKYSMCICIRVSHVHIYSRVHK